MKIFLKPLLLIFCLISTSLMAQNNDSPKLTGLIFADYSYNIPGGDMSERFGNNSGVGGGFLLKTKSNWLFGFDGNYLYGNNIKNSNSVLERISTNLGFLIDGDGLYAEMYMYESGFLTSLKFGKLFPVFGSNKNSGLFFISSIGMLEHKIRFEHKDNIIPQLSDDYVRGYDHLTNGVSVSEFIGYMQLSGRKNVNFFVGFEFTQAWTKCQRKYDFSLMKEYDEKNFDLLSSFKIGWIIPIKFKSEQKFYYN